MLNRLVQALHLYSVPANTTCDGLFYFTQGFQNFIVERWWKIGKIVWVVMQRMQYTKLQLLKKVFFFCKIVAFLCFSQKRNCAKCALEKWSKNLSKQPFFSILGQNGTRKLADDNGAEVLDGLGSLHLLDQLILLFTPKIKKCYKLMVKKSKATKKYSFEWRKNTWRQGAR